MAVRRRRAVLIENGVRIREIREVVVGAEGRGAGGTVGARRLNVERGQVGLDLVGESAEGLRELVAEDITNLRAIADRKGALLLTRPADRRGLRLADRHRQRADRLITGRRRRSTRGDILRHDRRDHRIGDALGNGGTLGG